MQKPLHTPGPWAIRKGSYGALWAGPAQIPHPGKESLIRRPDLLAQRDADAALVAAAPAMLAALREVEKVLSAAPWLGVARSVNAGALATIRAAIAKAEG
jgi:hypothetical protein